MSAIEAVTQPSYSQDELIDEFTRLAELVREQGSRKAEVGAALASIAAIKRGTTKTVHLVSSTGKKLDVVFGTEFEYNTAELMEVSRLLKEVDPKQFEELFEAAISFKPKKQALNVFLNTGFSDERLETAKQMIIDATLELDKAPYIKVVK